MKGINGFMKGKTEQKMLNALPEIKKLMNEGWSASYACSKFGINYGTYREILTELDEEFLEMVECRRITLLIEGTTTSAYKKLGVETDGTRKRNEKTRHY